MAFCSQCGTTLPDDARFCPKCGTATPAAESPAAAARPMPGPAPQPAVHPASRPGRGGLILPIVIVVALAVIAIAWWTQRDGARPIAGDNTTRAERSERAEVAASDKAADAQPAEAEATPAEADADTTTTTAASLDSAFHADPDGARARYDGPVTVSGTIATMVTPGPTPALSLEGRTRFNFVLVNFPSGTRGQLAELAKGDRITVSCRSVGALAGTTVLQGCALE